jgi:hypothetical protein
MDKIQRSAVFILSIRGQCFPNSFDHVTLLGSYNIPMEPLALSVPVSHLMGHKPRRKLFTKMNSPERAKIFLWC